MPYFALKGKSVSCLKVPECAGRLILLAPRRAHWSKQTHFPGSTSMSSKIMISVLTAALGKKERRGLTGRSTRPHPRLARGMPLAIRSQSSLPPGVYSGIIVSCWGRLQAARLRSSRMWLVSSSVRLRSDGTQQLWILYSKLQSSGRRITFSLSAMTRMIPPT